MSQAIHVPSGTADSAHPAGVLAGINIRESAVVATAAEVIIRNGTTATDPIVYIRQLVGDEQHVVSLPAVACRSGIFVDRVAGTTEIVLYVGD